MVVQRHIHQFTKNRIEQPAWQNFVPWIVATPLPARNNIVAFVELFDEARNLGWVILQIRVHGENNLTFSRFIAERQRIRFYGRALELSRYEYGLLKTLIARPGRVWSRDELLERVWDDPGDSLDRTVDAHVKTLRAKLKAVAPDVEPIRTHRGSGYALAEDLPPTAA